MSAIKDPLGQTHSPASSDRFFYLKVVLFCEIMKSGDRMDGLTGTDVKNRDHYRT